jgi:NADH-quinone oxidoreductase subunit M
VSTVWLGIGRRERVAVLTLAAMILGGGLFPQPGVTTRELAAEEILNERARRLGLGDGEPGAAGTQIDARHGPNAISAPDRSAAAIGPRAARAERTAVVNPPARR